MKKRLGNVNVNISNRAFYSILLLSISILVVSVVLAFGTQNPSTFGHSAKELDLSSGVAGNAVFLGNVNVTGSISPGSNICFGNSCISSWDEVNATSSSGGSYTGNLVNSVHTGTNCVSANGIPTEIQGNKFVCRFISSTCPSGWTQYQKWSATSAGICFGSSATGCYGTSCSTGSHTFSNKTVEASCTFTNSFSQDFGESTGCAVNSFDCGPTILEIGCF